MQYQTLYLQKLMHECEKIESCKKILDLLKNQKPSGANYLHRTYETAGTVQNDIVTRLQYRVFAPSEEWSLFFCWAGERGKTFYQTSISFAQHIQIYDLNERCKLQVSPEQDLLIRNLVQMRAEHTAEQIAAVCKKS